jgi:hypothetical protein
MKWLLLFFLAGCDENPRPANPQIIHEIASGTINRCMVRTFHDDIRQVTCWTYCASLSCVADSSLNPDGGG